MPITYTIDHAFPIGSNGEVDAEITFEYSPASKAPIPRGEYRAMSPDDPESVEVTGVKLSVNGTVVECPAWLLEMIATDEDVESACFEHASADEPDDDYAYERSREEW
jgi:hypothetical protein